MQVLCKTSNVSEETRCTICGQGFVLYWERQTEIDHAEALRDVETELRNHHRSGNGVGRPDRILGSGDSWQCAELGAVSSR